MVESHTIYNILATRTIATHARMKGSGRPEDELSGMNGSGRPEDELPGGRSEESESSGNDVQADGRPTGRNPSITMSLSSPNLPPPEDAKVSVTYARYLFTSSKPKDGESVDAFVTRLRKSTKA